MVAILLNAQFQGPYAESAWSQYLSNLASPLPCARLPKKYKLVHWSNGAFEEIDGSDNSVHLVIDNDADDVDCLDIARFIESHICPGHEVEVTIIPYGSAEFPPGYSLAS